ncbi:MAG: Na-translocating system protein MpsC family protein [Solirubrobacteraceae bacterium]
MSPGRWAGDPSDSKSALSRLSDVMARMYKDDSGRGPTVVRSYALGADGIVCVLEDTQTPVERRLTELGELQRVREVRLFFRHASEEEIRAAAEEVTGRRVRAFLSGLDARADVCAELFLFEPPD